MSNHTPGPWRAVFGGSIGHYSVNTDAKGYSMRTVVSGVRERDAHLIAAAPEMLEALEAFLEVQILEEDDYADVKDLIAADKRASDLMMKALKKARREHE